MNAQPESFTFSVSDDTVINRVQLWLLACSYWGFWTFMLVLILMRHRAATEVMAPVLIGYISIGVGFPVLAVFCAYRREGDACRVSVYPNGIVISDREGTVQSDWGSLLGVIGSPLSREVSNPCRCYRLFFESQRYVTIRGELWNDLIEKVHSYSDEQHPLARAEQTDIAKRHLIAASNRLTTPLEVAAFLGHSLISTSALVLAWIYRETSELLALANALAAGLVASVALGCLVWALLRLRKQSQQFSISMRARSTQSGTTVRVDAADAFRAALHARQLARHNALFLLLLIGVTCALAGVFTEGPGRWLFFAGALLYAWLPIFMSKYFAVPYYRAYLLRRLKGLGVGYGDA